MSVSAAFGETLDALLWRVLGTTVPIDAIYALNPGLAALGPLLPAGTQVTLPETPPSAAPRRETIKLWD